MLYSTRGQDGGNGHALAFVLNGGQRAPRAWEIVLGGMGSVLFASVHSAVTNLSSMA